MFLPWRAEIPGGHRPWVTLCLIAANVAVGVFLGVEELNPDAVAPWLVADGAFRPLLWIESSLVHYDWTHLIANMFFLWAFGLVVEGVAGAARFLALYCVLAFCGGAAQALLGNESGAVGTWLILYGLMITAAIWAPLTKMWVLVWIVVRAPRLAETNALALCLFWLAWTALTIIGFGFDAAVWLVVAALGVGAAVAVAMRLLGWVEPPRARGREAVPEASDS